MYMYLHNWLSERLFKSHNKKIHKFGALQTYFLTHLFDILFDTAPVLESCCCSLDSPHIQTYHTALKFCWKNIGGNKPCRGHFQGRGHKYDSLKNKNNTKMWKNGIAPERFKPKGYHNIHLFNGFLMEDKHPGNPISNCSFPHLIPGYHGHAKKTNLNLPWNNWPMGTLVKLTRESPRNMHILILQQPKYRSKNKMERKRFLLVTGFS